MYPDSTDKPHKVLDSSKIICFYIYLRNADPFMAFALHVITSISHQGYFFFLSELNCHNEI